MAGVGLLVVVLSLGIGSNLIPPDRVVLGLLGLDEQARDIVVGNRLSRTVLALLVGAALGLAGALLQALTRNPLADPGLLGVNAGAAAAVVTAIGLLGVTRPSGYLWFAMAGAGAAAVLVYLLGAGRRRSATPVRLLLAGVALTAVLSSYTDALMLSDPFAFSAFRFWSVGSLAGRDLSVVGVLTWFLVGGLVLALALARGLNALGLGEDTAVALGVRLGRTRLLTVLAVTVLCGAATASVGLIAFVGLAVPPLARGVVGGDHRWSFPAAALVGAVLLLATDIVGRVLLWPQEVGVGIVTAVLGAPVLIWMVRRGKVARA